MPPVSRKTIRFFFLNPPPIELGSCKEIPLQNTTEQTSLLAQVLLHNPGDLGSKLGHPHFCTLFFANFNCRSIELPRQVQLNSVSTQYNTAKIFSFNFFFCRFKYFLKYSYLSNSNFKFSMLNMKIAQKILYILNIMLSSMLIIFKIIFMLHP